MGWDGWMDGLMDGWLSLGWAMYRAPKGADNLWCPCGTDFANDIISGFTSMRYMQYPGESIAYKPKWSVCVWNFPCRKSEETHQTSFCSENNEVKDFHKMRALWKDFWKEGKWPMIYTGYKKAPRLLRQSWSIQSVYFWALKFSGASEVLAGATEVV